jgi:hypothetical protein
MVQCNGSCREMVRGATIHKAGTKISTRLNNVNICPVGYNEFDFLKKIKNTVPLMSAKFKSKTHLLYTFFLFLATFFARLASKFEKKTYMT